MAAGMKICTFVVNVLATPLHVIYALGLFGLYKRLLPICLYRMTRIYNKRLHDTKKELFSRISQFKTPGKQLTLLEIGCGTGANFQFFPPACKVICTDPNPFFEKYLASAMAENVHLSYERFAVASGEDLGLIEDESVDVVVCSLVLCSVRDTPQTLREVLRVLRPGGAFFFLEHVVSDKESSWTYFCQHVLQPFWFYFGDGCEMTRATWKPLQNAGFSELNLEHIQAPLMFLIKPHIRGYAVK
ncbi:putative methyltransferase-like protein 7A isoform X1 [Boleophthalmus pectinirostris]|uniref:putative methyltransferase-like protein 7A isoform X1 n=1 Tax=Boleophthalmus pectinirostris TaxID=150288 RepID=UPI00242D359A|nr:putative methyltransferase-like protein 7A isoform X1 [Boleophthalmus pectinirostris]